MFYNSFSDYMLDNRYGIAEGLRKCRSKRELIEKALDGYDWAVSKAIEHHESYKMLRDAIIEELGEEKFNEIEGKAAKDFMRLNTAVGTYYQDIKHGKRVGYSVKN